MEYKPTPEQLKRDAELFHEAFYTWTLKEKGNFIDNDGENILYDVPSVDGKLVFQIKAKWLNPESLQTLKKSDQKSIDWYNTFAKNPATNEKDK